MSDQLNSIDVPSLDGEGTSTCKDPKCIKIKIMPDGTEQCIKIKCTGNTIE